MKNLIKIAGGLFIFVGFVSFNLLPAQEAAIAVQSGTTTVDNTAVASLTDLEVMLQAVEATPPLAANAATNGTAYYTAQHAPASAEPWPPLPADTASLPAWNLGDGVYLLDDRNYAWGQPKRSKLSTSAGMMTAMDAPGIPGGGSGGGASPDDSYYAPGFPTNGLYLQITNTANGLAYLVLNNPTDTVYEVMSKPNLGVSGGWTTILELWPDNTNAVAFTVPMSSPTNLFFWAMDWTGVTENGNGTPDWWFWLYFGTTALSDTNLDSTGNNTLGYDYSNNLDPNVIQFSIGVTNDYVNTSILNVPLNVTAGTPSYYAVLVNGGATNWQPYVSSSLTIVLGSTDGAYDVQVGLKGLPANATQTWEEVGLTLDTAPAQLVITNLSSLSGSRPFIDPAGYSTKALSSLTFTVTNSQEAAYADQGTVFDQQCNPADRDHTTNWFACLDVALTLGTNYIGINAVDWAGNVTTTNFSYVFDTNGDTTPPAMALTWPQEGMVVDGTNFTLRGMLDDDTATVSGEWTDTNGVTNIISGLVERGGQFWLENLPLNPGTNVITITATDAAGNVTRTNLTLIQGALTLTMDTVNPAQLNQVRVNVTGEISDPTYSVWVNGVQGTNNGDGTWGATNVPVTAGGTASFDVTAYPPAYAPSGDSWTNFAVEEDSYTNPEPADPEAIHVDWDKPAVVYVSHMKYHFTGSGVNYLGYGYSFIDDRNWSPGDGGYWNEYEAVTNDVDSSEDFWDETWPDDAGNFPVLPGLAAAYGDDSLNGSATGYTNRDISAPDFEWIDMASSFREVESYLGPSDLVPLTVAEDSAQVVKLFTGGKAERQVKNLFVLNQALYQGEYEPDFGDMAPIGAAIPPQQISLGSYGNQGTDGNLYVAFKNDQNVVITPQTAHAWYGGNLAGVQKYTLTLTASTNGTAVDLLTTNTPEFCVGQYVTFALNGLPTDGSIVDMVGNWQLPTKYVNEVYQPFALFSPASTVYDINASLLANTNQTSCWFVNGSGGAVSIGLNLHFNNGQYASVAAAGNISVYRPTFSHFHNDQNGFSWGTAKLVGVMEWDVKLDSKYDGLFGVTQLLNTDNENSDYYTGGYDFLDGSTEIYGTKATNGPSTYTVTDNNSHSIDFYDSPADIAFPCANMMANFTDYLRFQPSGSGNIYVTIATNGWYMNGHACLGGSISPDALPPATAPVNSDTFPTWVNVRSGGGH
jgi:hypothetical protein